MFPCLRRSDRRESDGMGHVVVSAVVAYSSCLAITRGTNESTQSTNWWIIFMYFLEYWLKSFFFRYLVNSMQNQARSTNWHSAGRSPSTCWPPLLYTVSSFALWNWSFANQNALILRSHPLSLILYESDYVEHRTALCSCAKHLSNRGDHGAGVDSDRCQI